MSTINTIPPFQRLFVVSDLHMGGKPGFQMFEQGERLGAFIQTIARQADGHDGLTGLVLNGDTVDFLAETETPGDYLNPHQALERLQRIAGREAFKPVFDALAAFTEESKCRLVLVLGNHDLELALPEPREWLLGYLSGGDDARRGRITLAFDGVGFRCRVGKPAIDSASGEDAGRYEEVLCVHGNEEDSWNYVDHFQLTRLARALNRAQGPGETFAWRPNAGTRMVVDVMNGVKKKFSFVDLLKPEEEGVLPALIALQPSYLTKLGDLLRINAQTSADKKRHDQGLLAGEDPPEGAEGEEGGPKTPSEAEQIERFTTQYFSWAAPGAAEDVDQLLQRAFSATDSPTVDGASAGESRARGGDPAGPEANALDGGGGVLGAKEALGSYAVNIALTRSPREALRRTLITYFEQALFSLNAPDACFLDPYKGMVGAEIRFLIAGHTHLHRFQTGQTLNAPNLAPGFLYLNTGSWANLIELPPPWLEPGPFQTAFDAFNGTIPQAVWDRLTAQERQAPFCALKHAPMPALTETEFTQRDAAGEIRRNLILQRPTIALVEADDQGQVSGNIHLVNADGDDWGAGLGAGASS